MKIQSARELGSKVFFCLKKKIMIFYLMTPHERCLLSEVFVWNFVPGIVLVWSFRRRKDLARSSLCHWQIWKTTYPCILSTFVEFVRFLQDVKTGRSQEHYGKLNTQQFSKKLAKDGTSMVMVEIDTDCNRLTSCERVGADHDLDPLTKDKLNFTLHGSLTWEI